MWALSLLVPGEGLLRFCLCRNLQAVPGGAQANHRREDIRELLLLDTVITALPSVCFCVSCNGQDELDFYITH